MAKNEKKVIEKNKKDNKPNVKKDKKKLAHPFRDMISELKKVTWPTKKELTNYSISVGVFVVLMAVITGLIDFGVVNLIEWLKDNQNGFASFFVG